MRSVLRVINWLVLGLIGLILGTFLFGDSAVHEGNSAWATAMVVLALTGMIWIPLAFVAAVVSLWLERPSVGTWLQWRSPAFYVAIVLLVPLGWLFI